LKKSGKNTISPDRQTEEGRQADRQTGKNIISLARQADSQAG